MQLKIDVAKLTESQKKVLMGIFSKPVNVQMTYDEEVRVALHDLAYGIPHMFDGTQEEFPPNPQLLELFERMVSGHKLDTKAGIVSSVRATVRHLKQDLVY